MKNFSSFCNCTIYGISNKNGHKKMTSGSETPYHLTKEIDIYHPAYAHGETCKYRDDDQHEYCRSEKTEFL